MGVGGVDIKTEATGADELSPVVIVFAALRVRSSTASHLLLSTTIGLLYSTSLPRLTALAADTVLGLADSVDAGRCDSPRLL